jgi:hypothetical protein
VIRLRLRDSAGDTKCAPVGVGLLASCSWLVGGPLTSTRGVSQTLLACDSEAQPHVDWQQSTAALKTTGDQQQLYSSLRAGLLC